jgi:DNA-binding transcriptional ArsR family regulator
MPSRRTAVGQSSLRTPLNEILGTETNVRLLRVLAEHDELLPPSELAREASLHLSGIGRALDALEETGIIEHAGIGQRRLARLRTEHPLASAIRDLFRAERDRPERLRSALQEAARQVSPAPKAVWLQGSYVSGSDAPGDPIEIGMISGAKEIAAVLRASTDAFSAVEREFDIMVNVRPMTKADLVAAPRSELAQLKRSIPLLGPPPLAFLDADQADDRRESAASLTHGDLDTRALRIADEITEAMQRDPRIAGRALDFIEKRLAAASPGERHELREWEHVLRTMSPHRLRKFLRDPGERATRLRQTLPFLAVLSDEVRERLFHIGGTDKSATAGRRRRSLPSPRHAAVTAKAPAKAAPRKASKKRAASSRKRR